MTASPNSRSVAHFSDFELDLETGELRRLGTPQKLQAQPAKLLVLLVSRAGAIVGRDELVKEVWGSDTFVDFEQGLNFAIRQIRAALDDDAEHPRFLETLPKRGYRFIAPVKREESAEAFPARPSRRWLMGIAAAFCLALLLGLTAYLWYHFRRSVPTHATVVAVLPFDDLSPDPQDYLVDGLTEEMIAKLTRVSPERLRVIARTSAMQYRRTQKSARQIGQELGADYILESSIRHEGGRLRITAQLVRVSDQTHLWAKTYDRDLRELLPLESEVTADIAEQIHRQLLSPIAVSRPVSPSSADPDAHELYLKGRYYFNQRSREGLQKSIACFQQALVKDPHYAAAYAGLADTYNLIAFYGFDPSQNTVAQAKIASDKALQMDDSLAGAHAARAYTEFMYGGDWSIADKEFKRALELDDNYVSAHHWYALYLAAAGRMDESLSQMRVAQQLDPLSPAVHAGLGYIYYFARDYDLAVQHERMAMDLNSNFMVAHAVLGSAYIEQKKYDEAILELQTAVKLSDGVPVYVCELGRAYALSGNTREARKLLTETEAQSGPRGNGTALAALNLALGDSEKAMEWLEQTAPGDIQANWLQVDPAFDSLRGNPRFVAVLRRVATNNRQR